MKTCKQHKNTKILEKILEKLSISTIYSKVSRKEIPAFKIGKRLYSSKQEIIAWIKSGKIKTIVEIRTEINKR